jgi:hypothetical protein
MADPVDELEVLVSLDLGPLEDDLEEAVDKMDRLDDQTTDDVERELDDAAEAADDLSNSIDDADANAIEVNVDDSEIQAAENAVEDLDGKEANVDVDVDEEGLGGRGRDRVRLPGELDEVQEGVQAIGLIPPQIQALAAAATAATAALGAGAGLAGVATALAKELGPQGLQNEVKAVQSSFKQTGQEFAEAFSGVIRGEVLPAARGLAQVIRGLDDTLAAFSQATLNLLKNIPGGLGVIGDTITGLQAAGRATGQSNADALTQGTGGGQQGVEGIPQILTTMNRSIARVRERFEQDLIPREEMLSQIKSFRLDAFKSLQKLKQQIPGAFPPDLLDSFAAKLRKVKRRLKEVQQVSLEGVAEQPADAQKVQTAGPEQLATPSVGEILQGAQLARLRLGSKTEQFKALNRVGTRALTSLSRGVGRIVANTLTLQNSISSVGDAFRSLGNVAVQVLQQVISKLASAAAIAAVLGPLLGISSAGVGGIFTAVLSGGEIPGVASGGFVKEGGLARIHKGETIVPANVTSGVSGAGNMAIQKAGAETVGIGGGSISIDIPVEAVSRANEQGRSRVSRTGRRR